MLKILIVLSNLVTIRVIDFINLLILLKIIIIQIFIKELLQLSIQLLKKLFESIKFVILIHFDIIIFS